MSPPDIAIKLPAALTFVVMATTLMLASHATAAEDGAAREAIADQVEQYLVETISTRYDGEPIITVTPPALTQGLVRCQSLDVYMPPGRKLRSDTTVGVRCAQGDSPTIYVRAKVTVMGTYYVTAQTIGANQVISEPMLESRIGDLLLQPAHALLSPDQIMGRITTQRIPVGMPVRLSATRSRNSVQRGDTVRVEIRGPGLIVTSQGEAMTAADTGGSVSVKTPNGKTIQGVVGDSGTVLVTF